MQHVIGFRVLGFHKFACVCVCVRVRGVCRAPDEYGQGSWSTVSPALEKLW